MDRIVVRGDRVAVKLIEGDEVTLSEEFKKKQEEERTKNKDAGSDKHTGAPRGVSGEHGRKPSE